MGDASFDAWFDAWFDALVRETHYGLRAAIAGMGVPATDADDVAQEVYLDLAQRAECIPDHIEAKRWLHGMARNCSYEYFRRRTRQHHRLVAMAHLLDEVPASELAGSTQTLDALSRCLERLRPEQRQLLEAHYRHGGPIATLAADQQRLGSSMHMVFSRLRDVLRKCIQRGAPSA